MSLYSIKDTTLTAIGDAIREKNGTEDKYTPEQMVTAIQAIVGGGGGTVKYVQLTNTDGAKTTQVFDASPYIGTEDNKEFIIVAWGNYANTNNTAAACKPNILLYDGAAYSDLLASSSNSNITYYIAPRKCKLVNGVISLTRNGSDYFKLNDNTTSDTNYLELIYCESTGGGTGGSSGGGITPEGEIQITENGTYDVTEYASAVVEVAGSGSSSALPTPPEGGWVWSNSPWRCAFRNVISSTVQSLNRDYWVFDVSECDELTITVTTPKAASSSTTSSIYGVAVYGKSYELTSAGASGDAQYTITQVDATTKEDSRVTVASGSATNVRTYTGTFDVSDYTVFAIRLYPAYGSSSAPDHIACYVSNLSYT